MAFLQARRLERNGAIEQGTERAERLHDSLAAVTALLIQLQQIAAAASSAELARLGFELQDVVAQFRT